MNKNKGIKDTNKDIIIKFNKKYNLTIPVEPVLPEIYKLYFPEDKEQDEYVSITFGKSDLAITDTLLYDIFTRIHDYDELKELFPQQLIGDIKFYTSVEEVVKQKNTKKQHVLYMPKNGYISLIKFTTNPDPRILGLLFVHHRGILAYTNERMNEDLIDFFKYYYIQLNNKNDKIEFINNVKKFYNLMACISRKDPVCNTNSTVAYRNRDNAVNTLGRTEWMTFYMSEYERQVKSQIQEFEIIANLQTKIDDIARVKYSATVYKEKIVTINANTLPDIQKKLNLPLENMFNNARCSEYILAVNLVRPKAMYDMKNLVKVFSSKNFDDVRKKPAFGNIDLNTKSAALAFYVKPYKELDTLPYILVIYRQVNLNGSSDTFLDIILEDIKNPNILNNNIKKIIEKVFEYPDIHKKFKQGIPIEKQLSSGFLVAESNVNHKLIIDKLMTDKEFYNRYISNETDNANKFVYLCYMWAEEKNIDYDNPVHKCDAKLRIITKRVDTKEDRDLGKTTTVYAEGKTIIKLKFSNVKDDKIIVKIREDIDRAIRKIQIDNTIKEYLEIANTFSSSYEKIVMQSISDIPDSEHMYISMNTVDPDLFVTGYSRDCPTMPTEIQLPASTVEENLYDILDVEAKKISTVEKGNWIEKNDRYYTCNPETNDNGKTKAYKYIGQKNNTKLENKDQFPLIPCCYKKEQKKIKEIKIKVTEYKKNVNLKQDETGLPYPSLGKLFYFMGYDVRRRGVSNLGGSGNTYSLNALNTFLHCIEYTTDGEFNSDTFFEQIGIDKSALENIIPGVNDFYKNNEFLDIANVMSIINQVENIIQRTIVIFLFRPKSEDNLLPILYHPIIPNNGKIIFLYCNLHNKVTEFQLIERRDQLPFNLTSNGIQNKLIGKILFGCSDLIYSDNLLKKYTKLMDTVPDLSNVTDSSKQEYWTTSFLLNSEIYQPPKRTSTLGFNPAFLPAGLYNYPSRIPRPPAVLGKRSPLRRRGRKLIRT
jgi:hypothetical protein